jgi:hypothetical protein
LELTGAEMSGAQRSAFDRLREVQIRWRAVQRWLEFMQMRSQRRRKMIRGRTMLWVERAKMTVRECCGAPLAAGSA